MRGREGTESQAFFDEVSGERERRWGRWGEGDVGTIGGGLEEEDCRGGNDETLTERTSGKVRRVSLENDVIAATISTPHYCLLQSER